MGIGATGGFVLDNVAYGKQVASLALRVLDGESAGSIPVAVSEFTRPVFDWRQLQRWKISESRLPEGSDIRYRELKTLSPGANRDWYRSSIAGHVDRVAPL
jgi:hypothetical protein